MSGPIAHVPRLPAGGFLEIGTADEPEKTLEHLKLMDTAARSISDSDIVDSLIHGVPAASLYDMCAGSRIANFELTLHLQARMPLKVSGDKSEIRRSYIASLFVQPLMDLKGASAADETIQFMDEYFLTREDWDTIVELGVVCDNADTHVLKKISTATKRSFTRKYSSRDHPVTFRKAEVLGKVPKKLAAAGPAPDRLSSAFGRVVDDEIMEAEEEKAVSRRTTV
ncbi:hypothetical protein L226DRAFT_591532 [Lentinus tigrinus ALCF2SS1-7]|uniref:uncharacterized protein n=1 Tax=Lentinus tigrinus ALCF2SS1-7 TaxID=1328758 RepID=UPI001165E6BC|nr:hypothetical protein L226DRAFT_591532 [Lentinus tigrinus ALCF2SS1-7]